jgi:thiol-disulfide isomerase/thioredoxin
MYLFLSLLTGASPDLLLDQIGGSIRSGPAAGTDDVKRTTGAEGGTTRSVVTIGLRDGQDLLLRIDPATKLLSAIELKIDTARLARSEPPGSSVSIEQFGWTAGTISTRAATEQTFAFEPPKDFTKIELLKDQPGGGPAHQYAIEDMLGKAAPDFTLSVLDGPNKTRTITKAELAGQVVVLDFWTTWCRPCLMELPEIQKLIESYADSKKAVRIVALSLDSAPAELSEVRKLVEHTLREKKLDLARSPVGAVGLDPSGSVGQVFNVEGFPTLVILDGKGIVRSAHVGFNPETAEALHKLLSREIDALLEGKTTTSPEAGAKK